MDVPLVEFIDEKGIGMAQPIWGWGCPTKAQKWPKNTKNAFLACFWAYVGQPHGNIGWAIPMPFASMNSTNPRTAPWNFHKKLLRIGDFEKWPFLSRPFWILFFQKKIFFFCFTLMKISHKLCVRMDGTQFLLLWWYTAKNEPFVWSVTQLVWFFQDLNMANLLTGPGTYQQPL